MLGIIFSIIAGMARVFRGTNTPGEKSVCLKTYVQGTDF